MNDVWTAFSGEELRQGDVLVDCAVPVVSESFSLDSDQDEVFIESRRLIVVTQSCDLVNAKSPFVALCPVHTLREFENSDARFSSKGRWEEVRRGKIEGLFLLPGIHDPQDNQDAMVVDFRLIVSLPIAYLARHAQELNGRPRLQSPYVEHFSQSFARFFMRVGLPSQIPAYK